MQALAAALALAAIAITAWAAGGPAALVLAGALLLALATFAILALRRRLSELGRQALRDEITGFSNQRAFWQIAPVEVQRPDRGSLSLIAIEIDHLGDLNELYGHLVGDAMLRHLADSMRGVAPGDGRCFRYEGAQLVMLAAGCEESEAVALAERVRGSVREDGDEIPTFTVSAGVATLEGAIQTTPIVAAAQLFDQASRALRVAKRAGRDRTMPASSLEVSGLELIDPEVGAARRAAAEMAKAALVASDIDTARHSEDVVALVEVLGEQLGIRGAAKGNLLLAARLHDIGKIAIPPEVLNKPAELDEAERALVKKHTIVGEQILRSVPELAPAAEIVRHSHEHWDGGGYPDGLKGDEIPLGSRVILCADAFHAIRSDRPYRSGRPGQEALPEIRLCAGRQFDPGVVEALERVASESRARGALRRRLPPRLLALLAAFLALGGTAAADQLGLVEVDLPLIGSAGSGEAVDEASSAPPPSSPAGDDAIRTGPQRAGSSERADRDPSGHRIDGPSSGLPAREMPPPGAGGGGNPGGGSAPEGGRPPAGDQPGGNGPGDHGAGGGGDHPGGSWDGHGHHDGYGGEYGNGNAYGHGTGNPGDGTDWGQGAGGGKDHPKD